MELPGKQLGLYSGKVRRIGVIERVVVPKATFNNNSNIFKRKIKILLEKVPFYFGRLTTCK
jgi:hypothetical protein